MNRIIQSPRMSFTFVDDVVHGSSCDLQGLLYFFKCFLYFCCFHKPVSSPSTFPSSALFSFIAESDSDCDALSQLCYAYDPFLIPSPEILDNQPFAGLSSNRVFRDSNDFLSFLCQSICTLFPLSLCDQEPIIELPEFPTTTSRGFGNSLKQV